MSKPNILHLVEYLYLGGIERLLEQLAVNTGKKANIHFFSYESISLQGIGKQIQEHGFPVYTYKKSAGRDWRLIKELIKVIKEKKIDVIHTHDFGPVEYGVLLKIRFPRLKLIHTQHTIIHFVRHRKYTAFFEFASYFYSSIIAVSAYNRDTIIKHCPMMKKKTLTVIANGVDTDLFKPRGEIASRKILGLVSIARISNEKNLNYLFNTCRLLKEAGIPFVFHHAGTGKLPENLLNIEKFIETHQMRSEVVLHGFTNDVLGILNLGDIFLSASHTEGHPVSVLEAMACEKLCFCSDIAPHRELGDSVILFDKENENSLFKLLKEQYMGFELDNRAGKMKIARENVIAKYSIEKMVEKYVEQY